LVVAVSVLGLLAQQACSAGSSTENDGSGASGSGASGASGTTSGTTGPGGFSGSGGSGPGGGESCAEEIAEANTGALPADIIFVVDNSGSMTDEAVFVQQSMNDFSNIVIGSGIDAHVILISADSTDDNGICVPTPLGSGSCPNDEALPVYRHVAQTVGSSNALDLILSTYPQWQDSLRAGATKTITVVTDDDSSLSAADFTSQLIALDSTFADFTFHGIIAPYELDPFQTLSCTSTSPPNCANADVCCGVNSDVGFFCNPLPADEGAVYKALIAQTGGVEGNLCTQNFVPVFQAMATEVVAQAQVPCVYDIPPDPGGQMIDPTKVNVEYKPDPGASAQPILNVPEGEAGCGTTGGWYYDDAANPTTIILCDTTCDAVQAGSMPSVSVKFGCATQIK
jgi:hypothetical protein